MTTARTIIKKSMQKAGILFKDEDPSADEITDGLDSLNALLSSWSTDSLLCYARVLESFPLTSAGEYTIGIGQDFNTTTPISIIAATIRWDSFDYALDILREEIFEQYITDKNIAGLPRYMSYNNGYPIGRIRLNPTPMSAYTLRLLSERLLSQFALDDTVDLPAGWERALIYNLAVELAPEYGMEIAPKTQDIADKSLGAIKTAVARARTMDATPISSLYRGNIYNGWYV